MEESKKRKAHVTFGTVTETKLVFRLLSLIALARKITVPEHQTHKNLTYTNEVMNRFHEVNELYGGTLNKIDHFMYYIDITINEYFIFRNAMKQEDKMSFVEAMEKEISDHEAGCQWSVVHRDTLPNKARPIKSIWSFKRKRKPESELLKHIPDGYEDRKSVVPIWYLLPDG